MRASALSLVGLLTAKLVCVVEGFVAVSSGLASSFSAPKTDAKSWPGGRLPRAHDVREDREQAMMMFFGGSSGVMPKLYDGWFKKTGQIAKDIVTCTKSALKTGKPVEVCFFPVPNVEEVSFGTALNKAFGTEVALDLGMGEYKPGSTIGTYLVQYSNVYWAKKLADGLGGTVWVATTDGLKKDSSVIKNPGKAKFCNLRNPESLDGIKKGDTVIVVDPGPRGEWFACSQRFKDNKLIFLNGSLSESYDLGGPLASLEQAYFLKRVSKGYVFRAHPKAWEACLEKPGGGLEILNTWKDKPPLREAAKMVREESMERFGLNNDRWTNDRRMGGRL